MTAEEVRQALRRHYRVDTGDTPMGPPEWSLLDEFALRPGLDVSRAIDVLAVRAWSGKPKGHERHAIEIKVSRSDWRKELARPQKRAPFEAIAHRFYFAAPAGDIIRAAELPPGAGLYLVNPDGTVAHHPAHRRSDPDPLPEGAFVEAVRRASRVEARIRNATVGLTAARVVRLDADLTTTRGQLERRDEALAKIRGRFAELARYVPERFVFRCLCGQGELVPTLGRRGGWRHVDADVVCGHPWLGFDHVPEERPPA